MTVARHAGRVTEDGSLRLRSLPAWRATLARHKGREVWLEVHRVTGRATQDQHGYYRSTVLPLLAEEGGWGDPDELHYWLKVKFIPTDLWVEKRIGKQLVVKPPSSGDLTVEQYSAFLQAVLDLAADSGVAVPPPRGRE